VCAAAEDGISVKQQLATLERDMDSRVYQIPQELRKELEQHAPKPREVILYFE
jgi:hypothetical protein